MELENKEVFTDKKSISLTEYKSMDEEGDIILNPDYQRDYVYKEKQASALIESVLIGIPIPTIYLCQENDERYSVIDGQQRITSFIKYLKNDFALTGLNELKTLNGKKFKDLDKDIQRRLKKCSLETIIILKQSAELKYEIFARLNQGAVSLKPQELRNCIYRGSFNNMIEDIAKNNKLLPELFCQSNKRKSYQENILRFFALKDFTNYKSSMKVTMNKFMEEHQNDSAEDIAKMKNLYNGTIDIIKQILGKDAFWGYEKDSGTLVEKFSGSIYDSIVIPFSMYDKHELITHADSIRADIDDLKKNDDEYKDYTYAATGSKKRVIGRITAVHNILLKYVGSDDSGNRRTFSEIDKKALWYDGYICSYCNNTILSIEDAEVDHIIPYSQGGKTELSNAQLLHRHCNREKSDSLIMELDENNDNWEEEE